MEARAAAEGFALPPAIAIADASRWYANPATMPCVALAATQALKGARLRSQSHRKNLDLAGASYIRPRGEGIGIFDTRRVGEIRSSCLIVT